MLRHHTLNVVRDKIMKPYLNIFIICVLIGCSKSNDHLEEQMKKIEFENDSMKMVLEKFHYKYSDHLDSNSLYTSGCFLPKIVVEAPTSIKLGDTFVAKVYISQIEYQANIKMTKSFDSTISGETLIYNQESITYKCVPNTKGPKVFEGDYIHDGKRFGLANFPFQFDYKVK